MFLQGFLQLKKLVVKDRGFLLEFVQASRGSSAGSNVFTLSIHQVLTKKLFFAPVEGFRVKAIPLPKFCPMLPKTMAWMMTAVLILSGMSFSRRQVCARGLFQEEKTAPIAFSS